jgi:hypothetical protein
MVYLTYIFRSCYGGVYNDYDHQQQDRWYVVLRITTDQITNSRTAQISSELEDCQYKFFEFL